MIIAAIASVGVWLLALLGCAWLTDVNDPARRRGALALSWLGLLAAFGFPHAWVIGRFLLTAAGLALWFRTRDLIFRSKDLSLATRLWFLVALFDIRRAQRSAPELDLREARWLLLHLLITTASGFAIVRLAPQLDGPARWLVRWGFGAGFCFGLVEVLQSLLLIAYALGGVRLPRINDFPITSVTLAEFWGRRWNRVVAGWLRDYLFYPLARRRKLTLGVLAAFAGSMALHFWLAFVPVDAANGLLMASFFAVQAIGLLLERRLGVGRWPVALSRGWTIAWLLLSSPLFVEPSLRIYFGPP